MAGMAFANAFLGVCHSMAHKLGAYHHLPHGVANALMICHVLRYNAAEVPAKMGTFRSMTTRTRSPAMPNARASAAFAERRRWRRSTCSSTRLRN